MSKIYADTIETANPNVDLTFGTTGDAVLIPTGATLKTNTIQDAGGNNIITSNGSGSLTVNSGLGGAVNLLTNNTFTNTEFATFTTLIDSTYDVYLFKYIEINPDTNDQVFNFQGSTNGGTGWGVTQTTTFFRTEHNENDAAQSLAYQTGQDLANSAGAQPLAYSVGEDADSSLSGELYLFSPSSTTYAKNYYATTQWQFKNSIGHLQACESLVSGYFNTTSAVDAVRFGMTGAAQMDGTIKMYGISKS